jgi:hypothetical protein
MYLWLLVLYMYIFKNNATSLLVFDCFHIQGSVAELEDHQMWIDDDDDDGIILN